MAKKSSKTPAQAGPDSETDSISAATPNIIPPESHDTPGRNGHPALQPMRLKVLYSIDDLLPNCLARAKDVVHVRVAHLDENTPVGFVDLKTCVLNIVYSSPEIMHHQGCDYSVYTYDYSEPDTPMTGLGLLSWVLSLPTLNGQQPDPDAIDPAQANRLVTGRVQKNLLGIFAGDVRETLEVRMRLCRVPTLRQVDYLNHMNQYSQLAQNIPPGVDPASVWTNAMGQNGIGGQYSQQQQHGGSGGMAYPYAPQGVSSYPPMGQLQQPPPGHISQPPHGYPQPYPQNLQPPYQNQPSAPLQQSHGTQAPSPASTQFQSSQQADVLEGGAPVAPSIAEGPSPAPSSSQTPQASETPAPPIGSGEQKAEPIADPTQPAVKKRRVSTKKPTGKPRGRPRLTDIRKSNTDVQPPSREGLPQDPAAADAATVAIKQAPTPSSAAPSPSLTSVSTSNLNHTSTHNTLPPDSNAGSPHPSLSQATPLPPSSAAPSPATLAAAVSEAGDMATRLNTMSPLNEDGDVEMTQDIDNDADTEIAESPRDSDVDSLFIGSSPPPSHSEPVESNEPSPALDTSPVLPRQPSKGFFPSQPRQSSFSVQDTFGRDEGSEDELALPSGSGLLFPTVKGSEKDEQDKSSPAEKVETPKDSPKDIDESASSTSQTVLPRKRGRPPKNPELKADQLKKQKEKKSNLKTDPLPSDLPIPTSPVEQKPENKAENKQENKPKSKKSSVPMLVVPTTNLPSGLILPAPLPKENDSSRKRRASDAGSDNDAAPAKRGSTTALVRARIERQMLEKIAAGEMPTYCMHCGAIETPTWRKAKVVMTDPETGSDVEREVTLCNPCGLWHHNHGTMRPDQYWDKKDGEDKPPKPKKKKQKKRVCLAPEGSVAGGGTVVARHHPCPSSPPARNISGHRATSPPGPDRDGEWDHAVNKNIRRIQSSPCGLGTIAEPISLLSPDQKTRRKLFPEAKKSSTGLDGALTPRTEGGSEMRDPKAESMSPVSLEEPVDSPEMEKENNPPPVDNALMELDWERELERTLMQANAEVEVEAEGETQDTPDEGTEDVDDQSGDDGEQTPRPRTPINQTTGANPEFKTPIRLTPLLASINVDSPSFWKSGMLGVATPSGKLISGHPTPTPSKLLMNMNMNIVSPATGEIMLEFLNEWNKAEESMRTTSPTPANGPDDDNDEAFFSEINLQAVEQEMGLTSEGNAMPSSPPALFNLYDEEPASLADGISSSLLSDILPTSPGNATTYTLDVGDGPTDKEVTEKPNVEGIDLNFDFDTALVVDFSELVASGAAAKVATITNANDAVGSKGTTAIVSVEKKESSEDDSCSSSEGK
ncbi:hypothetical protein TWF718_001390 [Orbilia javanica]|uniref:GATA-type domain-containing protein n=1 Tax=Orbilia javanica TaxID=47235 RepID=A0AAN8N189_9PEZI